ncbi:MAG TPA: (Fe-S)-binding protein [Elusimicrobiota bacterium]|nr:(Fe-S)-binding protein [Elusimicrobiota bacterium]
MKDADKPVLEPRWAELSSKKDEAGYEAALHCNRCGFCTSFCPTYLATGDEGRSPRGRNQTFRALLEGRLKDPVQGGDLFDTCLLCGICTSVCFAEVPTAKLMSAAREKVMQRAGEPWLMRGLLRSLLPRPRLFEFFLQVLFWGKRLGVSRALNRLGVLGLLDRRLAAAEELTDSVPRRFLRDLLPNAPPDVDVVQFVACGPSYAMPAVGEATHRLVRAAGKSVGRVDNVCCGLPALSLGDSAAARVLAEKNIAELEKYPRAVVLADDSSCAATLKEYPSLFEEGEWRRRAEAVSRRTKDLSEWLAENRPTGTPLPPTVVTYHDPCKARYGQKIVDAPRALLAATPGVDYRELPEADQCCGGGGTYSFLQPEISRQVLSRKIRNIESTGAAVVLTSAVSCLLQIRAGLKWTGSRVRAFHLSEFLSPPPASDETGFFGPKTGL